MDEVNKIRISGTVGYLDENINGLPIGILHSERSLRVKFTLREKWNVSLGERVLLEGHLFSGLLDYPIVLVEKWQVL